MTPYRNSAAQQSRTEVTFGDRYAAKLTWGLGVALVALSSAIVAWWWHAGGRIHGSVLLPAIAGVNMILWARWGTLRIVRERGVVEVTIQRFGFRERTFISAEDVTALSCMQVRGRGEGGEHYELKLLLRGGREVFLSRAATAQKLEPARLTVIEFLLDHRVLPEAK